MKRFMILMLFLCSTSFCISQRSTKVSYAINELLEKDSVAHQQDLTINSIWTFNDTVSIYYFESPKFKPAANKKGVLGSYYIPKARYTLSNDSFAYHSVYLSGGSKNKRWRLIRRRLVNLQWYYPAGEKEILGYKVKPAITFQEKDGLKDTVLVWYSSELQSSSINMAEFTGLHGTPLEIHDQRVNQHILAVKIEKSGAPLVFPREVPPISEEEFWERRQREIPGSILRIYRQ